MSVNQTAAIPDKKQHNRFGKFYWSIDFEYNDDLNQNEFLSRDPKQVRPVVGTLQIGNKKFDVTLKELEKLYETVSDVKHGLDMSYRLGMLK